MLFIKFCALNTFFIIKITLNSHNKIQLKRGFSYNMLFFQYNCNIFSKLIISKVIDCLNVLNSLY